MLPLLESGIVSFVSLVNEQLYAFLGTGGPGSACVSKKGKNAKNDDAIAGTVFPGLEGVRLIYG
jgi:hypothetical protein